MKRCGETRFVCGCRRGCRRPCAALPGHPGPHGCAVACQEAVMVASMYDFLATGRYRPYVLVGEN